MRVPRTQPEFSPLVAVLAWLAAFVAAAVGQSIIVTATGYADIKARDWPLWLQAATLAPLWVALVAAMIIVSRMRGTGRVRRDYGLVVRPIDAAVGFPAGVLTQMVFVPLLYVPVQWIFGKLDIDRPAKDLTNTAKGAGITLLVILVVVGAPIIEELFFRGLVLRSFQARVNDGLALLVSATLFGLAHFQPLQLPGLILFGLVAGYLAQRTGRLGASIFAHAGFNAYTVAVLIARR
jgi:membrane protease YdiL (CAAX protease family)